MHKGQVDPAYGQASSNMQHLTLLSVLMPVVVLDSSTRLALPVNIRT